jgi:2-polyprenyl-3-methyl-5-hydroxy-6-metoxy-1,4-benzoquinol methylase
MQSDFDDARAERFAGKLAGALDGAALGLMISLGHRSGLFDVMHGLAPATPAELARRAGLAERYVREWLAALASAGVLDHDPASGAFSLPAEHAAALTRAARPHNRAAWFQWIPLLGALEDQIVTCFERGGGVPATAYGRSHAVMAEASDQSVVAWLLERILPLAPGLPARLARGADVLDVGCGGGAALCRIARAFPRARCVGIDCSDDALRSARALARELGLANVRFEARDTAALADSDAFDLVTAFGAIHHQARPEAVLRRVAAALRPEGTLLMQEVSASGSLAEDAARPLATFLYTLSCLHCVPVSLAAGGEGLGAPGGSRAARRLLSEAGFGAVEAHALPHDPLHLYYVARKA